MASIFTGQVPDSPNNADGAPGIITATTFVPAQDGVVSAIRFYSTTTVGGTYTGSLHEITVEDDPGPGAGTLLDSGVLAGPPASGSWVEIPLDAPVLVTAGVHYRAALHNSQGRYVASSGFFLAGNEVVNGDLTAPADGSPLLGGALRQGEFAYTGTATQYPNQSSSGSCYFIDVVYTTGSDPAEGTVAGTLGLAVAVAGAAPAAGSVAGSIGLATAAAGSAPASGTVAATLGLASAATGATTALGAVAASLALAVSARGSDGASGRPVTPYPFGQATVEPFPWAGRPVKSFSEVEP
jgi:hypothetical protein